MKVISEKNYKYIFEVLSFCRKPRGIFLPFENFFRGNTPSTSPLVNQDYKYCMIYEINIEFITFDNWFDRSLINLLILKWYYFWILRCLSLLNIILKLKKDCESCEVWIWLYLSKFSSVNGWWTSKQFWKFESTHKFPILWMVPLSGH
jgi:hypothetical protein